MRALKDALLSLGLSSIPLGLFLFAVWLRRKRRVTRFKSPLNASLLRPPGESLRLEIQKLDDELADALLGITLLYLLMSCGLWIGFHGDVHSPRSPNWASWLLAMIFVIPALVFLFLQCHKAWKAIGKRADYRLGWVGERAVGEELTQLLGEGWYVFHDLVFDENPGGRPFNIDHVAIGAAGVFAIETKTRRKPIRKGKEDPANEVVFDGMKLHYPWGADDFGVKQARKSAAYLSEWLGKVIGRPCPASAVLVLPGWMVVRRSKPYPHVVSGREIAGFLRKLPASGSYDQQTLAAIRGVIEQKNRTIKD